MSDPVDSELHAAPTNASSLDRREFLAQAVTLGTAALAWPRTVGATTEVWEEGDLQCRAPVAPVQPTYALDEGTLTTFIQLSEALTGVSPLDQHLARQYLERFAAHPQLTTVLPPLLQAYRDIAPGSRPPAPAAIDTQIMQKPPLRFGAEQLIYLWYVSAFYLSPPPDPTKRGVAKANVWIYGSPEHYDRALLWSVIRAHAPMTPGGPPGYWADPPTA